MRRRLGATIAWLLFDGRIWGGVRVFAAATVLVISPAYADHGAHGGANGSGFLEAILPIRIVIFVGLLVVVFVRMKKKKGKRRRKRRH